jgi:hypothetical protein
VPLVVVVGVAFVVITGLSGCGLYWLFCWLVWVVLPLVGIFPPTAVTLLFPYFLLLGLPSFVSFFPAVSMCR